MLIDPFFFFGRASFHCGVGCSFSFALDADKTNTDVNKLIKSCAYIYSPETTLGKHSFVAAVGLCCRHRVCVYARCVYNVYICAVCVGCLVESNEGGRAASDFYSFSLHGFATGYVAEGPVDDIVYGNSKHTANDEISGVNFGHAMRVAVISFSTALEALLYQS